MFEWLPAIRWLRLTAVSLPPSSSSPIDSIFLCPVVAATMAVPLELAFCIFDGILSFLPLNKSASFDEAFRLGCYAPPITPPDSPSSSVFMISVITLGGDCWTLAFKLLVCLCLSSPPRPLSDYLTIGLAYLCCCWWVPPPIMKLKAPPLLELVAQLDVESWG